MDDSVEHMALLSPGEKAPDFCLPCTPDQKVSLHEFSQLPVVLAFYPSDWSPVCGDELALFNEVLPEIKKLGAVLLAISVDSVWSHMAYSQKNKFHFPLLSDFEPKGYIARQYGIYNRSVGTCGRGLFVVNGEGIIHWNYLSPLGINPGADGVLEALESLNTGKSHSPESEA